MGLALHVAPRVWGAVPYAGMRPGPPHERAFCWRSLWAPLAALPWSVALSGCGDLLGSGASPEAEAPARTSLAEQARSRQEQAATHFGVPLETRDARGVRYRLVPPGSFRMGSAAGEPGRRDDEAQYVATLLVPYYLQATEATWGEVRAFDPGLCPPASQEGDDRPAHGLTHDQVQAFIDWVNAADPTWYHRLPSEAEWELACRAGSEAAWSSGATMPEDAWAGVTGGAPRVVGLGRPNGYGLHDMHGNVAEWCRPWYAAYPACASDLPVGPLHGVERVVRGGSWADRPAAARSAARAHQGPQVVDRRVGFRLLLEAGYAVPGLGSHRLRVQTYTGEIGTPDRTARPGYRLRLVSVPERLMARQEDRPIRWRELEAVTPLELQVLPGRYYLQAWRLDGEHVVRGAERKFMVPDDLPEVDVEIPPG